MAPVAALQAGDDVVVVAAVEAVVAEDSIAAEVAVERVRAVANAVRINDVSPWLSELSEELIAKPDTGSND